MTTTGRAPVLRHILIPRRTAAAAYTTILSLRDPGGRRRYLAALPDGDGAFLLARATRFGRWRPWARAYPASQRARRRRRR